MKILACVVSLALFLLPGFHNKDVIKQAHAASHVVIIEDAKCSSTAIGPHALLTATHCEDGKRPSFVLADGKREYVEDAIRDKNDHTIFLLDGPMFTTVAGFEKTELETSDDFFIFGNPGPEFDVYRRGYVCGKRVDDVILLDLNGWHGDSGAAMFNMLGKIAGVISYGYTNMEADGEWSQTLMGARPLKFTSDELFRAVGYMPDINLLHFQPSRPGAVIGLFPELKPPLSARPPQ